VVDQPSLRITHAYLFPNPTESRWEGGGGQFVVDAPGDSVNVLLRIYTASGRLIRTLTVFGGLGQVQAPWDGLDEEGQPLANGVYFFRAHVNPRDPDGTSSPRQKAHADGRFVIVNRK
jgi:flagellar hook assembly protein FlgD